MSRKRPHHEPGEDADRPAEAPAPSDAGALAAERDDLLERLRRVSADYLNYQKRQERALDEARQLSKAGLVRDLLPVLDDMERAMTAAAEAGRAADEALVAGMRLVYDKALEALARHGVRPIEAEGAPFDPTRHEAMMHEPSEAYETPTVVRDLQRGYEVNGRVLRPARVVVSSRPEAPADEGPPTDRPRAGEDDETLEAL